MKSILLKLSQISAETTPKDAELVARLLARDVPMDAWIGSLHDTLNAQERAFRTLQDLEAKLFVLMRAKELQTYQKKEK